MVSNRHRHQNAATRRSGSVALGPYFVEDVAMTPSELEQVRATNIRVDAPR